MGKTYICKLMEITNSLLSFLNTTKHLGNCTLYFVLGVKYVTCLCVIVCIKLNLPYYTIFNSFIGNQLLYVLEIKKSCILLDIKAQHLELLFSYISSKIMKTDS